MDLQEQSQPQAVGQPSVHSDNKEERLAARKRRVQVGTPRPALLHLQVHLGLCCTNPIAVIFSQVRIEAMRRAAAGEQPQGEDKEVEDPERDRKSQHQVEHSMLRLEKLVWDGTQLVTNVATAGDSKEVQRRQEEEEARRARWGRGVM